MNKRVTSKTLLQTLERLQGELDALNISPGELRRESHEELRLKLGELKKRIEMAIGRLAANPPRCMHTMQNVTQEGVVTCLYVGAELSAIRQQYFQ